MTTTFADLGLPAPLVKALRRQGFDQPFPIQAAAIPDALDGRDIAGEAPTGSGKTLAFGLPILVNVPKAAPKRPTALVLSPTRELAEQIKDDLAPLADSVGRRISAIYGGVGYGPQLRALRSGVDVLVATPGRLEDLLDQRSLRLDDVGIVVVDEGDRMADMGFLPAVRRILDQTSRSRQTLLFSATLDGDVAALSRSQQTDPVRHDAPAADSEELDIDHHFWVIDRRERVGHVADVVNAVGRTVVFTRTRHGADRLARQLSREDVAAAAMHGGRSQPQRTRSLDAFASGKVQALVATDVAARGIHVDGVMGVVHFDPPEDAKTYIHRSGRTARAGATGTVVSLVSKEQRNSVRKMKRELDLDEQFTSPEPTSLRSGDPAPSRAPRSRPTNGDRPEKPTQRDKSRQRLYVANLPWRTTESDLESVFARHGIVHEATIVTDRRTNRSRGFGFVAMPSGAAQTAVRELNGSRLGGRDLIVKVAEPRQASPRTDRGSGRQRRR